MQYICCEKIVPLDYEKDHKVGTKAYVAHCPLGDKGCGSKWKRLKISKENMFVAPEMAKEAIMNHKEDPERLLNEN